MNRFFHTCHNRQIRQLLLLMALVVTGFVGCASPGKKVLSADMTGLKEQIWDLKKQNSELGLKISYIESDLSLLKEQLKAMSRPEDKTGGEPDTIAITSGETESAKKKKPVPEKKMVADEPERIADPIKKTPIEAPPATTTAEPMESTITEDRGTKTEEVVIDHTPVDTVKPEESAMDSEKMYKAALTAFNAGEYDVAVSGFDRLIRLFPGIGLAAHSQYWIGESYYVRKEFKKAIEEYRKVLLRWPESPRVPETLLKTGLSFLGLKKNDKGHQVLKRLIEEYPNHSAADTARRRLEK